MLDDIQKINQYQLVDESDHDSCIGVINHNHEINGVNCNIRLHHLKFDGNGRPMVKALANLLSEYIIEYCLSSRNRPTQLNSRQAVKLTNEAKQLFRNPTIDENNPDKTGEAGEMLLYFLMESVLKAPQMVSKMELKTNHKDEIKGSDGIHASFNTKDKLVDFYFGESKLYQSSSAAIKDAINSIEGFHDIEMHQHEFTMVTKHFKHADDNVKEAIGSLIISGEAGPNARVNHACLIGYDFKGFNSIASSIPQEISEEFISQFLKDGLRLTKLLQNRLDQCNKKHLSFEVFFIPFPSVSEFRNAFNTALN